MKVKSFNKINTFIFLRFTFMDGGIPRKEEGELSSILEKVMSTYYT